MPPESQTKLRRVKLASLIEDFAFYPRGSIDAARVNDYAAVFKSGAKLPPPVVDVKSMRIVDGFHRVRAYRKILGEDGEMEVELIRYGSDLEMLQDAISRNVQHGLPLQKQDVTRCIHLLQERGVNIQKIAAILNTTEQQVQRLKVRVVKVGGETQPVKPIIWNRKNPPKTLTEKQMSVAKSSSGWRPLQTIVQLSKEIEAKLLDMEDEKLIEALWMLHDAIAKHAPPKRKDSAAA